jgi:hypothetical protein
LAELLEQLGVVQPREWNSLARHARRWSCGLPVTDSAWIDALFHLRRLTSFQANELRAGRGQQLAVAGYSIERCEQPQGVIRRYSARPSAGGLRSFVHLSEMDGQDAGNLRSRLAQLVKEGTHRSGPGLSPIRAAGTDGPMAWAASAFIDGRTAADLVAGGGRVPPDVAVPIVRQVASALARLERRGIVHGDVSAFNVLVTTGGRAVLLAGGLRTALRLSESLGALPADPADCDSIAPERLAAGGPPTRASDVYAWACIAWLLLTGRPPFPGGTSHCKRMSILAGRLPWLDHQVDGLPRSVAETIHRCLARDAAERPASFSELIKVLGEGEPGGAKRVARGLAARRRESIVAGSLARPSSGTIPDRAAGLLGTAAVTLLGLWYLWRLVAPPLVQPIGPGAANELPGVSSSVVSPAPVLRTREVTQPVDAPQEIGSPPNPSAIGHGSVLDVGTILLSTHSPTTLSVLVVPDGHVVRGDRSRRATILVPPGGLLIQGKSPHLSGIDFVFRDPKLPDTLDGSGLSLVRTEASILTFEGCTFTSSGGTSVLPAAVAWSDSDHATSTIRGLPTGRIRFQDCVFEGVAAGVDADRQGCVVVEIKNSLHLGPGPLVQFSNWPEADSPAFVALTECTLRECAGAIRVQKHQPPFPGRMVVRANSCVFDPWAESGLVEVADPPMAETARRSLEWGGDGSILSQDAPFLTARSRSADDSLVTEEGFDVAGIVRGRFEYIGSAEEGYQASQVLNWTAPLQSDLPPGIRIATVANRDPRHLTR